MSTAGTYIRAIIRAGIITDVDPSKWTMKVRTPENNKGWDNVPIPSLYLHGSEGEGVHVMPEVGACIWICEPSEGDTKPFPVCYRAMPDGDGVFRSNRPPMNPGDIVMMTRDRNSIKVRRGGLVEISSTPLSKSMWIPTSNRIFHLCENWDLQHFGGSMQWLTARPEEDPNGKAGTQLDWKFKEFAEDKAHVARLRVGGQIDEDGSPVVDLRVYKDGAVDEASLEQAVSLTITKEGNITLEVIGDVDVVVAADKHMRVRTTAGNEQMVILGETFLTQLSKSLTELMAAATAIGMPTIETAKTIADIATSLGGDGATYLSTRLRTE